jgi:hypothetical protein
VSLLLSVVLVVGLAPAVPAQAYAEDSTTDTTATTMTTSDDIAELKAANDAAQAELAEAQAAVDEAQAAYDEAAAAYSEANAAYNESWRLALSYGDVYDEAYSAYKSAKAAYEDAVAKASDTGIEESSLDFFEDKGATDAVNALTTSKYASSTDVTADGDATNLDLVLKALNFIDECNEIRASEGVGELRVTDYMMAAAEADANWSDSTKTHAYQFNIGENLAWGYIDPFDGWYTDEKAIYDDWQASGLTWSEYCAAHPDQDNQTGHYTNIVYSGYTVTGFAISSTNSTFCQTFDNSANGATTYTVAEYRALLEAWISENVDTTTELYQLRLAKNEAADAVTEAYIPMAKAKQNIYQCGVARSAAKTAKADAKTALEEAQAALETAQANADAASEALLARTDVSRATIGAVDDQVYTGSAIEPDLTVTLAGVTLAEGTDYTVAYADNVDYGTASYTVTGTGDYTGTATGTFRVVGQQHRITKNATEGGTVTLIDSADGTTATMYPRTGDTVTFRTAPDTGYTLTRMSYSYTDPTTGKTVTKALSRISGTGRAGTNAVYSFTMPDADVTLNASFGENHRTIYKQIDGQGVLIIQQQADGSPATLYPQPGDKVRFKAIPARGNKLTNIYYTVEGQTKHLALTRVEGTTNVYEFTMPNWNVTLHAVFVEK